MTPLPYLARVRITLLMVLFSALLSAPAHGQQFGQSQESGGTNPIFADQEPAPNVIDELVVVADRYWDARGVKACPDGITDWTAPDLTADDGVYAYARAMPCEIWVLDYWEQKAAAPRYWEDAVIACVIVMHEVGHARGLSHSDHGIMQAEVDEHVTASTPKECIRWGKRSMREALEGENHFTERGIRRILSRTSRPYR
jgi:hypothetical protein